MRDRYAPILDNIKRSEAAFKKAHGNKVFARTKAWLRGELAIERWAMLQTDPWAAVHEIYRVSSAMECVDD